MIFGHGDDLYKTETEIKANFSTNVWYGADLRPLYQFLAARLERVFHYPEPDAGSFRKAVAVYHEMREENVLVGNGATELFYIIAHAFSQSRTVIPIPSFTEYEDACTLYRHRIEFVDSCGREEVPADADLMWICNPNNPDGRLWDTEEIRTLLENHPGMVVVVDESFIHFVAGTPSVVPFLKEYPNLLVVRSMTKCYAIPGLRLGYMLGIPERIRQLEALSHPWSVNVLAIEAGKYLLREGQGILPDVSDIRRRQRDFSDRIAGIPGFRPLPSGTSFFLVETEYDSRKLKRYLLEKHGLLIRDASNFRGLNNHYFRVNTLADEKNQWLAEALKQVDDSKLAVYE